MTSWITSGLFVTSCVMDLRAALFLRMCARFRKLVHSSSTLILRFGMERGSTRKPDQFATVFFKMAGTQKTREMLVSMMATMLVIETQVTNASDVRDDRVKFFQLVQMGR